MDELDYEAEFNKLTANLRMPTEPGINWSDITDFFEYLNEAALHVSRYIALGISLPDGEEIEIPKDIGTMMPQLTALLTAVIDNFHDIVCDDCDEDEEDDDDEDYLSEG